MKGGDSLSYGLIFEQEVLCLTFGLTQFVGYCLHVKIIIKNL